MKKILVFGASGSIGGSILKEYEGFRDIYEVYGITTKSKKNTKLYTINTESDLLKLNLDKKSLNGLIWAQGINTNDSILSFDAKKYVEIMNVNVLYILNTLSWIIKHELISENAKLCIISSIWQEISRQNKLSYTVSKSALKGLVLSLANDLSDRNIMVNAILPGVIDNSMTKSVLSKTQIDKIKNNNGNKNLAMPASVAKIALWLCSDNSEGISGEFIKVDYGYSKTRTI
jgi:NAD(P)-dependent dehydrogenase (short-subunit alcohol dehydrogenase family)